MSLREEQCNKVCRILDDVLANRPTERDSLILAVRKAFAEPQERKGKWIDVNGDGSLYECDQCGYKLVGVKTRFCPDCVQRMEEDEETDE